jgi:hypothetical protein
MPTKRRTKKTPIARARKQRRPASPKSAQNELFPTFAEAEASVPEEMQYLSGAPAATAIEAIIDHERNWRQGSEGQFIHGDERGTFVAMGDPRTSASVETRAMAWNRILALDDNTAQPFLYVMTRDLATGNTGEKTRIHVNEILEFKGFQRHHSRDFKTELKQKELERLNLLNQMWIGVNDEIEQRHGNGFRLKKIKLVSRLIELEVETEFGEGSKARRDIKPRAVPYAFRLSLGGWAAPYQSESSYVRPVLQKLVQYDVSRIAHLFAVRITLCLMFASSDRGLRWRLSDLLSRARIDLPTHHTDRFRQHIEEALDLLEADRIIGSWVYENDCDLNMRAWLDSWLAWDVVISPRPLRLAPVSSPVRLRQ